MSLVLLFFFFIQHFLWVKIKSNAPPPPPPLAPALYTFGDCQVYSGSSPGQNITSSIGNYYPYGIDFPIGATGRLTNGATAVDLLGQIISLPVTIQYSTEEKSANTLLNGYNYASGTAAGILPETGSANGSHWCMDDQIARFNMTTRNNLPKNFKCKAELIDYLSKSLFVVNIGTSDYRFNYFQPELYSSSKKYNPYQFGEILVNRLGQQLKKLYRLGARKIVVFEVAPLGCYPKVVRTTRTTTKCVAETNNLVYIFNRKLEHKIRTLRSRCKDANITLAKTYDLILDMMERPSRYGFAKTKNPCCLVRNDTEGMCIPSKKPCSDRNETLFWHDSHLTEAAHRLITNKCFYGSDVCTPNVRKMLASAQPRFKPCLVHLFFLLTLNAVSCFHNVFRFCW